MSLKRLFVLVVATVVLISIVPFNKVQAQAPFPATPKSYVYDEVGVFSNEQVSYLLSTAKGFKSQSGIDMVLAVLKDCGDVNYLWARNLFNHWGVGSSKTNKGFLLLSCWNLSAKNPIGVPGIALQSTWDQAKIEETTNGVFKSLKDNTNSSVALALVNSYYELAKRMGYSGSAYNTSIQTPNQPSNQPSVVENNNWTILGLTLNKWLWVFILIVVAFIGLSLLIGFLRLIFSGSGSYGGNSSYNSNYSSNDSGSDFFTGYLVGSSLGQSTHHHPAPSVSNDSNWGFGGSNDSTPFGGGSDSSNFGGNDSPFDGGSAGGDSSPFDGGSAGGGDQ